MTASFTGTVAGMTVGFAGWSGGLPPFLLAAAPGTAGRAAGHRLEGGGRVEDLYDAVGRGRR
ncbi:MULTISPECIES: hypothetical protein [unclassified Streptomyces]|uniref:hypothetical protein n=1 Tax=unclassified Streptomyces TaxID=2593676 RepID=UPI00344F7C9D